MDRERLLLLEKAAVDVLVRPEICIIEGGDVYLTLTLFPSQSPPYLVSGEQRKTAEAVFLDLRKTIHPYELCKYMLGLLFSSSISRHALVHPS